MNRCSNCDPSFDCWDGSVPCCKPSWHLANGEERNRATPDTFELPERHLRDVLDTRGPDKVGKLKNKPHFIEGLTFDQLIEFEPENVIHVQLTPEAQEELEVEKKKERNAVLN